MVDICSGDIQFLSGIDRAHFDSDQSERSILLVIESIPSLEENEIWNLDSKSFKMHCRRISKRIDPVWFLNSIRSTSRDHFFPKLQVKGKMKKLPLKQPKRDLLAPCELYPLSLW